MRNHPRRAASEVVALGGSSRWMQDDAVGLLLEEFGGVWSMLSTAPDPMKGRALLVGLTLVRFDDGLKRDVERQLSDLRWRRGWTPLASWLTLQLLAIGDDPESHPCCLSEREFEHYARENFGDTMTGADGIYHPPDFYRALVEDIVGFGLGAVAGVALAVAIPDAVIGSAGVAAFSPGVAKAAITAVVSGTTSHLFPGGSWDAARKDRLWAAYEIDLRRRRLQ